MARPKSDSVERVIYNKEKGNVYYKSRIDASKKYAKKFDDVRIRLPQGYRDVIHEEVGDKGTNAFMRSLIEQAIPDIAERAQKYVDEKSET